MSHTVAIINGKEPNAGNGGVSDADLSNIAVNFFTPGVVNTDDYLVEQQDTPNMTVKVNTGRAYVSSPSGEMLYQTELDTAANVTITSNAAGNPRKDAIVIKIDLSTPPDEFASNVATLVAVPGTAAASPSAPDDTAVQSAVGAGNAFLRLANVDVANGAVSISDANISSAREQVALQSGGFMLDEDDMASDSDTQVPTQQSVKAYVDEQVGDISISGYSLNSIIQTNLGASYGQAANTSEQEITGLRTSLPIIAKTCLVKMTFSGYVSFATGNNTLRIRVGTSTTYLSNSEVGQKYVGGAKTVEDFTVICVDEIDLSSQNYVAVSLQNDNSPGAVSVSASGARTAVIIEVFEPAS